MVEVREVDEDDWTTVREVRLSALADTPDWFWATYEDEVQKPEQWWRDFVSAGAWFIAFDKRRAVGVAAALPGDKMTPAERQLISMWVDPGWRGRGVGAQLVEAVKDRARLDGVREINLQVTDKNEGAARLYRRCGFRPTGQTEPLPRNPSLIEHEMRLRL